MRFVLGTPEHEPALRRLLRESAMPGPFRLAYAREPDLTASLAVEGVAHQVLTAVEEDRVVGMGIRAVRPAWVNGRAVEVGYLGGLRSLTQARGGLGLAQGYRFLRDLHRDGRVPGYLTTILESNAAARELLASRRAGLPAYVDLGRYSAYAVLMQDRRKPAADGLEVLHPPEVPLAEVLTFLDAQARRRQFGPVFGSGLEPAAYYRGFDPRDLYVARAGGRLVGALGVWDQRAYKQTLVEGYGGWLGCARPVLNPVLRGLGLPALPAPGAALDQFAIAFTGILGDDPRILEALLERVHADRTGRGHHSFLLGFHKRDPLREALRGFRTIPCHARLCWVCWDPDRPFLEALEPDRVPYLELARL